MLVLVLDIQLLDLDWILRFRSLHHWNDRRLCCADGAIQKCQQCLTVRSLYLAYKTLTGHLRLHAANVTLSVSRLV